MKQIQSGDGRWERRRCLLVARLRRPGAGFLLEPVRRLRPLARTGHPHAVFDDGGRWCSASEGRRYGGGGQAFCVRTCDGRHFPVTGSDNQSRAQSCSSLCPASETKVVYGGSIDDAATDNGKPYSEMPNAFRYRNELVSGCTCNGKDALGLAQVKIEDDPTLAQGRHRRRRKRTVGCRPPRQTRRRAELLARPRSASRRAMSARRWWRGSRD